MNVKTIVIGGLAALVLLVGGFLYGSHTTTLAGSLTPTGQQHFQVETFLQGVTFGTRSQSQFDASGKLTVGPTGTSLTHLNFGACDILAYANTIAASTTGTVDCSSTGQVAGALAGVSSGDFFDAYATTTISCSTQGCVSVVGSAASSTSGYGTLKIYNGTGATFTWTGAASTSIVYQDLH